MSNVDTDTGEVLDGTPNLPVRRNVEVAVVRPELDVPAVMAQVAAIQDLMQSVLKENVHYGVIKGCDKPSLLQAGAEKIGLMFRLVPRYTVNTQWDHDRVRRWTRWNKWEKKEEAGETRGHVRSEVICTLIHATSGSEMGSGIGVCNSWEKKYETQDPYNIEETIVQMARKRALVNAIRTATAASDIFTQDVEDIPPDGPENAPASPAKASAPTSRPKTQAPPANAPQGTADATGRLPMPIPPFCPKCGKEMWDNTEGHKADSTKAAWRCKDKTCQDIDKPQYRPAWWRSDPNDDTKTFERYAKQPTTYLAKWLAREAKSAELDAKPTVNPEVAKVQEALIAALAKAGYTTKDQQIEAAKAFLSVKFSVEDSRRLTAEDLPRALAAIGVMRPQDWAACVAQRRQLDAPQEMPPADDEPEYEAGDVTQDDVPF